MQTANEQTKAEPPNAYSPPRYALTYGHDPILLKSRQRILEMAGCHTEIVQLDSQFSESVSSHCPGVVVLCQTLLQEEGVRAASLAFQLCPAVPLLVLYNQRLKFIPVQTCEFLQSNSGPQIFADLVSDLMYRGRKTQSRLLV